MKKDLSPKFISSSSYAKKQTIPLDPLDPKTKSILQPFKFARLNAEISLSGLNKPFASYLLTIQNSNISAPDNTIVAPPPFVLLTPTPGNPPLQVENLSAQYSGSSVVVTFDYDLTDYQNSFFSNLAIEIGYQGNFYSYPNNTYYLESLNIGDVAQSITIDSTTLSNIVYNTTAFDKVRVATYDEAGQTLGWVVANFSNTYVCDLDAPVITATNAVSSYTITTTNIETQKAKKSFLSEILEEFVYATTGLSSAQVNAAVAAAVAGGGQGWSVLGEPRTVSPTTIFANDGQHRYVRAFFMATNGGKSPYSNYVEATPSPLIPNNTLPPANATGVSAKFVDIAPGTNNGDNILVSYTLPAISDTDPNKPVSIKVKLVPTAASGLSGFFYHTLASNTETSFTIPSNLIFSQFGEYYTSYIGTFVLVSQYGTESSTPQAIGTFSRTNAISSVIPTATITNVVDGYTVQFSLANTGASFGEVYQFFINPSFATIDMPDYMDFTYTSGGASGQKTIVTNSVVAENGAFSYPSGKTISDYVGYGITGTGIPDNTWVTSITGSGPYTITLNNNLNLQAAGNYHMQSLVYAGQGPANIFENYYGSLYIIVRYYDIYGINSQNSIVYTATPINPATSVIANAVQIGSGGSIYVGTYKDQGARIVLGPSSLKAPDGQSSYAGIFAFDYGSGINDAASTAIITNPSAGGFTFETQNAKIANWVIGTDRIQNSLGTSSNYVGMSAAGNYSFWAGSTTSGGDAQAKFSVTPAGKVSARDIVIYGSGNQADTLFSAGSYFTVLGDGTMTAFNANITGKLKVSQSSTFESDITVKSSGIIIAGNSISTGSSVQIKDVGLVAYDTNHNVTTQISSSPIGTTADGAGITFQTKAAYLGDSSQANPWIVTNNKIYSGKIELDSLNQYITIYPTNYNAQQNNFGVRLYGGSSTSTGYAMSVGALSGAPAFYVTHNGFMYANNANISGVFTVGADSTINGVAASQVQSGAAAGSSALQPNGTLTGAVSGSATINGVAASQVQSGASAGSTALQEGNGVEKDPTTKQITVIDATSGVIVQTGKSNLPNATYGQVVLNSTGLGGYKVTNNGAGVPTTSVQKFAIATSDGSAFFSGNVYGGSKTNSGDNANAGYYLGSDGKFTLGNSNGYLQYDGTDFKISTGNGIISIGVQTITGSGDRSTYAYNGSPFVKLGKNASISFTGISGQYTGYWDKGVFYPSGTLTQSGTVIQGLPIQGNADLQVYQQIGGGSWASGANPTYYTTFYQGMGNSSTGTGLGPYPRQRMVVEDARTGNLMLGMGIYYRPSSYGTGQPSTNSGYDGDLWVDY